ncbi:helix-turn-helix domain-containing protein [Streptomyces sp. FH025]|uniref:winged helix-turn-helix transcriptional regulator n=1 Tax=Streptomyces sp. FH025 TaxID=2815937 RepID=UPI001A9CE6C2|nr:winged helix-turn-helix transcriptional regulator [Streptomyces sp. FH025]MBO1415794.1 winged helix-turn-helix transcriptional regulator [Streptomyces sp. FH025]
MRSAPAAVRATGGDVDGHWTTLVLRELMHGSASYGELRERLPEISPKVLAERLRALGERELVARERLVGFPVRTPYRLMPTGEALRPLLVELYRTGVELLEHRGGAAAPPSRPPRSSATG